MSAQLFFQATWYKNFLKWIFLHLRLGNLCAPKLILDSGFTGAAKLKIINCFTLKICRRNLSGFPAKICLIFTSWHISWTEQSPNQSLIYCFNCKGSSSISRFIVSHSRGSPKNAETFSYDAHKMISWLTFSNLWRVILLEPVVVLFGINANTNLVSG